MALSGAELDIWLAVASKPHNSTYNVPVLLNLRTNGIPVDVRAITARILTEQPSLRRRIVNIRGVVSWAGTPLSDVMVFEERAQDLDDARRRAIELNSLPLDLTVGPLIRAHLVHYPGGVVLTFILHHIGCDAASVEIITNIVVDHLHGRPVTRGLPTGSVSEEDPAHVSALVETLEGAARVLTIPPPGGGLVGAGQQSVRLEIDTVMAEGLRMLARGNKSTPALIAFSTWVRTLHLFSGEIRGHSRLIVSSRTGREPVGLYSRALPIASRDGLSTPFADLARDLRDSVLDTIDCSAVDPIALRSAFHPEGGSAGAFLHVSPTRDVFDTPMGRLEVIPWSRPSGKFPISAVFDENDSSITVDYDSAVFDERTVRAVRDAVREVLVQAIADDRSTPADVLAGIDGATQRGAVVPEVASIAMSIIANSERHASAIAIVDGDTVIRYDDLVMRARRIASVLVSEGVSPGDLVALDLPASAETFEIWLGILFVGAAYVPLAFDDPAATRITILRDADPALVVSNDPELGKHYSARTTSHLLDAADREKPFEQIVLPEPDNLFNVLYTSGSTGAPKGVRLSHRGLSRLVCNNDFLPVSKDDVFTQLAPLNFDGASYEVWGALCAGAKLVILPRDTILSPALLGRAIRQHSVSVMLMTTPLLHAVAEERPSALSGLRVIYCGGDTASARSFARAEAWTGRRVIHNGYGPTENSFTSTFYRLDGTAVDDEPVPIGRPVPGTDVHVLSPYGDVRVGFGMAGEIGLAGDGLFGGYLGSDQRGTVEVAGVLGPVYRTGDRGRLALDGLLHFDGRVDHQVKIRGRRLELGAVRAAVLDQPWSVQAHVLAIDEPSRRIVAFVVPRESIAETEARSALAQVLPAHAVPDRVVLVDVLPHKPNGKIDERALRGLLRTEPAIPVATAQARVSAPPVPRTTREAVRTAWEAVTGRVPLGDDVNFFDAGGDSLQLSTLAAAVERETAKELSVPELLRHPTVRTQVALVDSRRDDQRHDAWTAGDVVFARHDVLVPIALSASSAEALQTARNRLAEHLDRSWAGELGDLMGTLFATDDRLPFRFSAVADSVADAVRVLRLDTGKILPVAGSRVVVLRADGTAVNQLRGRLEHCGLEVEFRPSEPFDDGVVVQLPQGDVNAPNLAALDFRLRVEEETLLWRMGVDMRPPEWLPVRRVRTPTLR